MDPNLTEKESPAQLCSLQYALRQARLQELISISHLTCIPQQAQICFPYLFHFTFMDPDLLYQN